MCKSFLDLKTFYTIQELNSIFLGEQSQKRIFSLSKMLKSLSHFHSLSTRLCELEHEEISPLLKKSIKFDNLLCKILKRAKIINNPYLAGVSGFSGTDTQNRACERNLCTAQRDD